MKKVLVIAFGLVLFLYSCITPSNEESSSISAAISVDAKPVQKYLLKIGSEVVDSVELRVTEEKVFLYKSKKTEEYLFTKSGEYKSFSIFLEDVEKSIKTYEADPTIKSGQNIVKL